MSDQIERLHRLFEGVWNGDNPDVADELVSSEYVIHGREMAEELRGPELYKSLASGTRESFPDMEFTIDDTVEEGTNVTLRWTMTGTHDGPMGDMEPTGEHVDARCRNQSVRGRKAGRDMDAGRYARPHAATRN